MKAFMKINSFLPSFTGLRENMKINSNHPCQCCLTEPNYLSTEDLMFWVTQGSPPPHHHELASPQLHHHEPPHTEEQQVRYVF